MTMSKSSEGKEQKNRQEEINAKLKARKEKKKLRIRKFPISLRILVVIIIFCICLLLGIMFGYSNLGDVNALDALKPSTCQHIIDIVEKEYQIVLHLYKVMFAT